MSLVAVRKAFPYLAFALLAAAVLYATSFGTLPRADLTFNNATEIKTLDPAQATGEPEGRVLEGLFEGLLRKLPVAGEPISNRANTPIAAQYATADDLKMSEDGLTYTFHIRETAKWSDGSPLNAHDFAWSWMRMLHPETVSDYKYQLHYVRGGKAYSDAEVSVGDVVEVELGDRPSSQQTFPRGTLLHGKLLEVSYPDVKIDEGTEDARAKTMKQRRDGTLYVVEIDGQRRLFAAKPAEVKLAGKDSKIEVAPWVLPDFATTVGIQTPDDRTLVVTLDHPTAYFPDLVAFYPLYPVNRECVEKYGWPNFTKAGNLVSNGPFKMQFRRIRDRLRMVKNSYYWNADQVQIESIDAMAIPSTVAALNMYMTGQLDWVTSVPATIIPEIIDRPDFHSAPIAATYFYRVNCTREQLDNPKVRRALAMSIDREKICEKILRANEESTTSFVPPKLKEYQPAVGPPFDPRRAQELLSEAGFPGGHGLKRIEILYNTDETHQSIAEIVQSDWKRYLGIEVELRGMEWGTYLNSQQNLQYDVARAGWTADYLDPITFIDMFVKNGANNQTGWSNAEYDRLVKESASEGDPAKRFEILHKAEQIFLDDQPILPICHYVSKDFVQPYVTGFYCNRLKSHPLHLLKVDRQQRDGGAAK